MNGTRSGAMWVVWNLLLAGMAAAPLAGQEREPTLAPVSLEGASATDAAHPGGDAASILRPLALPGTTVRAPGRHTAQQQIGESDTSRSLALRVAKWGALGLSAGAAAYGFSVNEDADRSFRELEALCDADPDRCRGRNPDGSFTDEALEGLYQDVLAQDDRARLALLVGQVGIAATVVLFILDLRDEGPPDIPYVPPPTLGIGPGGITLETRLPLPTWF